MSAKRREQAFTAEKLLHVLRSYPKASAYIVGFSGGADSTALLHALDTIRDQLGCAVSAVHVNHGLHKDSGQWQAHCAGFCQKHGIQLTCLNIELTRQTGKGLEAEARSLRYRAIIEILPRHAALLTAHHANDQAETVILNLMRGSGVDGLSAMPQSRPLGEGLLQRPLLDFTNEQLLEYLQENRLEWIDDPSNEMLDQDRNYIRHEVVPLLEQRWPGIDRRLLLTCGAMAEARVLLERSADGHLDKYLDHPCVLELPAGLRRDQPAMKLVIRRWVQKAGANPIPAYKLASFSSQLGDPGQRGQPELSWDGWTMRLHQNRLWLFDGSGPQPCPIIEWQPGTGKIDLGGDTGQLFFSGDAQDHGNAAPQRSPLTSGNWPTDTILISGRDRSRADIIRHGGVSKSLKKIFQGAGIPSWLRNCIPLCHVDGAIVAIGDWCFESTFEAEMKRNHVRMLWRPEHPLLRFIAAEQHLARPGSRRHGKPGKDPKNPASPDGS